MTELTIGSQIFSVLKSLFFVLAIFLAGVGLYNILRRQWNSRNSVKTSKQLVIKESLILDTKRRLVRIQNCHKEHLLLLGASEDLVIESYEINPSPALVKLQSSNDVSS